MIEIKHVNPSDDLGDDRPRQSNSKYYLITAFVSYLIVTISILPLFIYGVLHPNILVICIYTIGFVLSVMATYNSFIEFKKHVVSALVVFLSVLIMAYGLFLPVFTFLYLFFNAQS